MPERTEHLAVAARRNARRARSAVAGVLLLIGTVATVVAWRGGDNEVRRADESVAAQAEDTVLRTAEVVSAGLAGISAAVADDGTVPPERFAAYAREALPASSLAALAYEPLVLHQDRAAFEAQLGRPIADRLGEKVVVAPARDRYFPVVIVAPASETVSPLLGFDITGDRVRSAAAERARDRGTVVFSEPVLAQPSGSVSFFVVKALYRPGLPTSTVEERRAALSGYVSTAYTAAALIDRLSSALPAGTRVRVTDGPAELGATERMPRGGITLSLPVLNRTWEVQVDDPAGPGRGVVWLLAAVTVVVAAVLLTLLRRARDHDDAMARVARRATLLADLAQGLAAADTEAEVNALATTIGRRPIDADASSIGVIDGDRLQLHHGDTVPDPYRRLPEQVPLAAPLGFTEAAREGTVLLFEDEAAYRARFPDADGPAAGARAMLPLRRTDGVTIGAVAHLWSEPRRFDDAERATLSTIADLVGQALERTRLARAQAEDAAHTEALARLAQGLAVRTNSDAVMAFLSQGVLAPLDAVHATVGVLEGSGSIRRHHAPGPLADLAEQRMEPLLPLHRHTPLTDVARTGEPILLPSPEAIAARYPSLVRIWADNGLEASVHVPLRDRTGSVIGALGVFWDQPQTFGPEILDRLTTVAGIAGQTLERAALVDQIREDARRSEALAHLAAVLATARTSAQVIEAVSSAAAPVVEARGVHLAVYGAGSDRTVHLHPSPQRPVDPDADPPTLDPSVPSAAADVLRNGGVLTFADRDELVARYPGSADEAELLDLGASAVVALQASNGLRMGVVGFEWGEPVTFHPTVVAALRNVADLASQALERALLSDAEHRLVTSLQDSVLVPLPDAPGLATSGRYLPAARSVGMGGDWYEGIVLPDGRLVTVVGDIAGHGITAVGKMAQLRAVIGALVTLETPLEDVFPLATSVGPVHDLTIASAVVACLDPTEGTVRYTCAGHPPPLLRLPDGEVVVLDGGRQPLLGIPMTVRPVGEHPFPLGSTLVCYTDGLVERRGETIDESVDRLAAALADLGGVVADELADALLRRLVPNRDHPDDIALVVVTRTG